MKKQTRKLALLGAAVASLAAPCSALATVTVTVRVEGAKKELVNRQVSVSSGQISRYGHSCPSLSAAGAFNLATGGRWTGVWSKSLSDFEIFSIFGENYPFTQNKYYWELFVNNVSASTGVCGVKPLHPGEQILFAAAPDSGTIFPLALRGPARGRVGHKLSLKVVGYDAKGRAKALAGATVTTSGLSFKSSGSGRVEIRPSHTGRYVILASKAGYVRSTLTVNITK